MTDSVRACACVFVHVYECICLRVFDKVCAYVCVLYVSACL